jgi:hypothetical protein
MNYWLALKQNRDMDADWKNKDQELQTVIDTLVANPPDTVFMPETFLVQSNFCKKITQNKQELSFTYGIKE